MFSFFFDELKYVTFVDWCDTGVITEYIIKDAIINVCYELIMLLILKSLNMLPTMRVCLRFWNKKSVFDISIMSFFMNRIWNSFDKGQLVAI